MLFENIFRWYAFRPGVKNTVRVLVLVTEKSQNESKPPSGRGKLQNAYDITLMSAEKQLELRLRDFLLDIEDRIYQGTLGSIKVSFYLYFMGVWYL